MDTIARGTLARTLHARSLKIQVEFNPALARAYRLLGYEDRAVADDQFRDDTVDGGEVGAEHRVTALYEVVLAGQEVPQPAGAFALHPGEVSELLPEIAAEELVRVKVRYKQPGATDQSPAFEVVRALLPAEIAAADAPLDQDLAWAAAVAGFAELLRASPYASRAELAEIETIVGAQRERDSDRAEFADLVGIAKSLLAE